MREIFATDVVLEEGDREDINRAFRYPTGAMGKHFVDEILFLVIPGNTYAIDAHAKP